MYLGFGGLDLEIWSKNNQLRKKKKKGRKSTLPTAGYFCFTTGEGLPRGNSRDSFCVLGRDGKSDEHFMVWASFSQWFGRLGQG